MDIVWLVQEQWDEEVCICTLAVASNLTKAKLIANSRLNQLESNEVGVWEIYGMDGTQEGSIQRRRVDEGWQFLEKMYVDLF